jgi:chorismate synthase
VCENNTLNRISKLIRKYSFLNSLICTMSNTLGQLFKITSFGESHGKLIGIVVDGMPSNIEIDTDFIQKALDRRKPGQSEITTQRKEDDIFEIVSGVFEGKSTGAPITILIPNTNHHTFDYDSLKNIYRPGHADKVYQEKYGIRDYRGGGRSSARITAGWVAAGALAQLYLKSISDIKAEAVVSQIYNITLPKPYSQYNWDNANHNKVRCPDADVAEKMSELILKISEEKDSVGGIVSARILNCPLGLGEPLFDKLNANIAKYIFTINAVKAIEFGEGFNTINLKGSENNSTLDKQNNTEGGITAGISNGNTIEMNIAFKPTSSIGIAQNVQNQHGEPELLVINGRHDPCVLPRAVPIVEAMLYLVLADHYLLKLK